MTLENENKVDYRDTLLLPKTDLPMRASLPDKEPSFLEKWHKEKLFSRIREASKGREKFILHDGPPYANGNLHMGTALNKILKDVIVRSKQLQGFDAEYRTWLGLSWIAYRVES
jgi:isoleucyl-tRNA synthetase